MSTEDDLIRTSQTEDHVLTVRIQREVITDMATIRRLQNLLLDRVAQTDPCRGMVIDFDKVRVMSSQLFGVLLQVLKRCKAKGQDMVLCRLNPDVRQPIAIMRLDRLLKIFDSVHEAESALSNR